MAQRSDDSPLSMRLLTHLFYALLIRLGRMSELHPSGDEAEGPADIYRRFRLEVERHFKTSRSVGDYAAMLGYSEKSLYRAILSSAGLTPKQVIDERVSLEAQRLLVHTRWSLKHIAAELGFSEPSNFVKFFRRTVGQAPIEAGRHPRLGGSETRLRRASTIGLRAHRSGTRALYDRLPSMETTAKAAPIGQVFRTSSGK
jgi:AraC-like DNA-binding protein